MFKMKKKVLKKIIVALCAAAMSVPTAASVGAMHNGAPDNANHQQQNGINEIEVNFARSMISAYFGRINPITKDGRLRYNLDNEAIETSESLQQLQGALDNINNLDLDDEDLVNQLRTNLRHFNRYMLHHGTVGNIDKGILEKIKAQSDTIQEIINNNLNDDDI